jgi:hypothetical protein
MIELIRVLDNYKYRYPETAWASIRVALGELQQLTLIAEQVDAEASEAERPQSLREDAQ